MGEPIGNGSVIMVQADRLVQRSAATWRRCATLIAWTRVNSRNALSMMTTAP